MILNKPFKDYLFVTIQILLFAAYFLTIPIATVEFPAWLRYSGLGLFGASSVFAVVALLQLSTNLSPFPSPKESGQLVTKGVFRISRHPIYTALIFMSIGFGVEQVSIFKIIIGLLLLTLFYFKSNYEESLLLKKFPEYKDYKNNTRRFI
ncbi:methyltransferase family protein [Kaistella yonginensis]|uniref:methyltransferase family protein n=1 Tax=Kaistella yonginensis TaxID=658267 RepID=UPI0025B3D809|nr:isoprenylcysteine carboxylmethyltransferase family protein [Kaistella yonginensis]MDN3607924.1 isoprenylcysteine carboxylmethyltransferase family protein [Kaistella yonginensis]